MYKPERLPQTAVSGHLFYQYHVSCFKGQGTGAKNEPTLLKMPPS